MSENDKKQLLSLLATMNLEELLDAYEYIDNGLKGMDLPHIHTQKAIQFAKDLLKYNQIPQNHIAVSELKDKLTDQIVFKNWENANHERGKELYEALMNG